MDRWEDEKQGGRLGQAVHAEVVRDLVGLPMPNVPSVEDDHCTERKSVHGNAGRGAVAKGLQCLTGAKAQAGYELGHKDVAHNGYAPIGARANDREKGQIEETHTHTNTHTHTHTHTQAGEVKSDSDWVGEGVAWQTVHNAP
jgi:hypothetical protein